MLNLAYQARDVILKYRRKYKQISKGYDKFKINTRTV